MSKGREIRCYDYVNHPYEQVRAALTADAQRLFQRATRSAANRAEHVAAALRVDIGGVEIATDIEIAIGDVEETPRAFKTPPTTRIMLSWEAAEHPRLFPFMNATLAVYPITNRETQLELTGHYEPPLGALGSAINAVVGHRIADASVHRFLGEVAEHLRAELPQE
jgi:hypothetical protein